MALNFPTSPTVDQVYHDSGSGFAYKWNGTVWQSHNPFNKVQIKKIDDISSQFDGNTTSFNLLSSGNTVSVSAETLRVVLGGIVQDPGVDYTANASTITFTTAPLSGLTFSGILNSSPVTFETYTDGSITPSKLSLGRPNWNTSGDFQVYGGLTVGSGLTAGSIAVSVGATINGLTYPTVDGTANQLLKTDGAGNLSFGDATGAFLSSVVGDTTPQLGGNLDLNGNSITGTGGINFTGDVTFTGTTNITGNANISGVVTATDFNSSSDIHLKENISVIDDPLSKIMSITGISFDWKDSGRSSAGVIAQDVEDILPQIVGESSDGNKTVNYNGLIGLLVESVKSLTVEVEQLREELREYK